MAMGLDTGRCGMFFGTSPSGSMDEPNFYRFALRFVWAVGKSDWDASQPWDQQPAAGEPGFESAAGTAGCAALALSVRGAAVCCGYCGLCGGKWKRRRERGLLRQLKSLATQRE